jgi:RNA-binding protein YhbY
MSLVAKFQIGKQGVTQGVADALELALTSHHQIRISVLKAAGHDRAKMPILVEELKSKLKTNCNYRIIGFTIIVNKLGNKKPKKP